MSTTVVADLGMLAAMYGSGTLDADEFKKAKAKLLRDSPAPSTGEQTTPTELDSEAEEADSSQLTSDIVQLAGGGPGDSADDDSADDDSADDDSAHVDDEADEEPEVRVRPSSPLFSLQLPLFTPYLRVKRGLRPRLSVAAAAS